MSDTPTAAQQCYIFPEMQKKALLSIAKFCDSGHTIIFTPDTPILEHQTDPTKFFHGKRDWVTGMWVIDLVSLVP